MPRGFLVKRQSYETSVCRSLPSTTFRPVLLSCPSQDQQQNVSQPLAISSTQPASSPSTSELFQLTKGECDSITTRDNHPLLPLSLWQLSTNLSHLLEGSSSLTPDWCTYADAVEKKHINVSEVGDNSTGLDLRLPWKRVELNNRQSTPIDTELQAARLPSNMSPDSISSSSSVRFTSSGSSNSTSKYSNSYDSSNSNSSIESSQQLMSDGRSNSNAFYPTALQSQKHFDVPEKCIAFFRPQTSEELTCQTKHELHHQHSISRLLIAEERVTAEVNVMHKESLDTDHCNNQMSAFSSRQSYEDSECQVITGDVGDAANYVQITPKALEELRKIDNKIGDYICRLCHHLFDDAFKLAQHRCVRIVHVEYRCPECGKSFVCPANLASHRRWHRPRLAAPSLPSLPSATTSAPATYLQSQHTTVHSQQLGTGTTECTVDCDQTQGRGGRATAAPLTFTCVVCSKCFKRRVYLRKHLTVHARLTNSSSSALYPLPSANTSALLPDSRRLAAGTSLAAACHAVTSSN